MAEDYRDYTGCKKDKLTVTGFSHRKGGVQFWDAKCECGKELKLMPLQLATQSSCGCDTGMTLKPAKKHKYIIKMILPVDVAERFEDQANKYPNNATYLTWLVGKYGDDVCGDAIETKKIEFSIGETTRWKLEDLAKAHNLKVGEVATELITIHLLDIAPTKEGRGKGKKELDEVNEEDDEYTNDYPVDVPDEDIEAMDEDDED